MKKTTAMMAASLMIMSLVLGGCGTTGADIGSNRCGRDRSGDAGAD